MKRIRGIFLVLAALFAQQAGAGEKRTNQVCYMTQDGDPNTQCKTAIEDPLCQVDAVCNFDRPDGSGTCILVVMPGCCHEAKDCPNEAFDCTNNTCVARPDMPICSKEILTNTIADLSLGRRQTKKAGRFAAAVASSYKNRRCTTLRPSVLRLLHFVAKQVKKQEQKRGSVPTNTQRFEQSVRICYSEVDCPSRDNDGDN